MSEIKIDLTLKEVEFSVVFMLQIAIIYFFSNAPANRTETCLVSESVCVISDASIGYVIVWKRSVQLKNSLKLRFNKQISRSLP